MGLFFPSNLQQFQKVYLNEDGSTYHIQTAVVLQHQFKQKEEGANSRWKIGFSISEKRPSVPKCPMTGVKLKGIKPSRPAERKRLSLRHKKVFRAYGGVLSHKAVREKIVRAFLIEEQKS